MDKTPVLLNIGNVPIITYSDSIIYANVERIEKMTGDGRMLGSKISYFIIENDNGELHTLNIGAS